MNVTQEAVCSVQITHSKDFLFRKTELLTHVFTFLAFSFWSMCCRLSTDYYLNISISMTAIQGQDFVLDPGPFVSTIGYFKNGYHDHHCREHFHLPSFIELFKCCGSVEGFPHAPPTFHLPFCHGELLGQLDSLVLEQYFFLALLKS